MKGGGEERDFLSSRSLSSSSKSEVGFEDSLHMLSSLSRNGLSMLAGRASLASLRNLAMMGGGASGKVCGGGFTGFYRASRPSLLENKACSSSSTRIAVKPDVENLSPDECWRLILKLGSRWPAWNGAAPATSPAPQDRSENLQLEQDSLKLIASRALEALAQRPDRHSRPMLAPKRTTQEVAKTKPIFEEPALPVRSSREMAAPKAVSSTETRTAPLTIFYAGTVNVCDNVPEDKARLIMLFAEKAGVPPSDASPECIMEEEAELHLPKVAPSDAAALESGGTPAETVPAESSPVSVKITISEGKSRRQQGAAKPLPNARKNSLARFLDKRKRPSAPCSEGQRSKKLSLGSDGCVSDGEELKSPRRQRLRSQSSIDSKEGLLVSCGYIMDAEMT